MKALRCLRYEGTAAFRTVGNLECQREKFIRFLITNKHINQVSLGQAQTARFIHDKLLPNLQQHYLSLTKLKLAWQGSQIPDQSLRLLNEICSLEELDISATKQRPLRHLAPPGRTSDHTAIRTHLSGLRNLKKLYFRLDTYDLRLVPQIYYETPHMQETFQIIQLQGFQDLTPAVVTGTRHPEINPQDFLLHIPQPVHPAIAPPVANAFPEMTEDMGEDLFFVEQRAYRNGMVEAFNDYWDAEVESARAKGTITVPRYVHHAVYPLNLPINLVNHYHAVRNVRGLQLESMHRIRMTREGDLYAKAFPKLEMVYVGQIPMMVFETLGDRQAALMLPARDPHFDEEDWEDGWVVDPQVVAADTD
ncbi:hypothetical protein LTS18_002882 [Coniosporium uncinatum]|uniref:Uncharacterized protein n=1 Tax=Coniosporium uncinatum TaxID=93489 RepID=A0ACC3DYK0_9PEZI|nr:hypothetical protein LTS18_002882 [Coniosporium uncinatum]